MWVFTAHDAIKMTHDCEAKIEKLEATLNLVPARTWYTNADGALTWVYDRTPDFLGLPADQHLR